MPIAHQVEDKVNLRFAFVTGGRIAKMAVCAIPLCALLFLSNRPFIISDIYVFVAVMIGFGGILAAFQVLFYLGFGDRATNAACGTLVFSVIMFAQAYLVHLGRFCTSLEP